MAKVTAIYLALLLSSVTEGSSPKQKPSTLPVKGQLSSQGCYKSLSSTATRLPLNSVYISSGQCFTYCVREGKDVMILHMSDCYCADTYPSRGSLVDDFLCDVPCMGFAPESCGGRNAYSVFNTGQELDVKHDNGVVSSTPVSSIPTSSSVSETTLPSPGSSELGTSGSSSSESSTQSVVTESVSTSVSVVPVSVSTATDKPNESTSSASPTPVDQTNDSARRLSNVALDLTNKLQKLFSRSSDRPDSKRQRSSEARRKGLGNKLEL